MKESTAILDIGSSTVVALVGEHGVNGTFKVCGKGDVSYAGFQNSEFLEPESLKLVISSAIANAEITSETKITNVYVGVPGEFCSCVTKAINLKFPKIKKVTDFDVDNIFKTGNTFAGDPSYDVINKSVVYFDIDGNSRVIDPVGVKAKSVTGHVSYILALKSFLKQIKMIFADLRINIRGFISANYAECMYMFEPRVRDKYALLVDVGYITTSVALARGNALLFLNSFSLGGGYITSDLSECLHISFNEAERLKHKVILGWNASQTDTYEIDGDETIQTYSAKATNEIVVDRIEMICDYIEKCLANCAYDLPDFLPIHVTGGGFNFIRGVKFILSKKLKRQVEIISPNLPNVNRPDYSSEVGLLNLVLNYDYLLDDLLEI